MKVKNKASLARAAFSISFAILMGVGGLLSIPMPGGIPFTTQNFFAVLSGLILGGLQGAGAVGLFLLAGIFGLPIFFGAKGGWEAFIGETGGYLWGYYIAAAVAGLIVGTPMEYEKKFNIKIWLRIALASLLAFALIYVPGIPWFIHVKSVSGNAMTFNQAATVALLPFIPTDILKFAVSVPLAAILRPLAARILYPNDEQELQELIDAMKKRKKLNASIAKKFRRKDKN